ncbi:hypothetical protein ACFZAV_31720 [Streptomyces sp. NPDC008343]|uniref:hypothetical protein n=1 Tax=Streptomyces sp. NPDC008343 TaxID=3364828 RepID=UPI0036EBF024
MATIEAHTVTRPDRILIVLKWTLRAVAVLAIVAAIATPVAVLAPAPEVAVASPAVAVTSPSLHPSTQ